MIFSAQIPQRTLCHFTIHVVSIFIASVGASSVKPYSCGRRPSCLILSWLVVYFLGTRIQNLVAVCCISVVHSSTEVIGRCVMVRCEGGLPVFTGSEFFGRSCSAPSDSTCTRFSRRGSSTRLHAANICTLGHLLCDSVGNYVCSCNLPRHSPGILCLVVWLDHAGNGTHIHLYNVPSDRTDSL